MTSRSSDISPSLSGQPEGPAASASRGPRGGADAAGDPAGLLNQLFSRLGQLQLAPPASVRRTYFDTFDWRLHRAGFVLVEDRRQRWLRTSWRRSEDNELLGQVAMATPRFARDLRPGPMQRALQPLLQARALLPVLHMNVTVHEAAVLDGRQKVILRVALEQGCAGTQPNACHWPLPSCLRLEPVKGFPRPALNARKILDARLDSPSTGYLVDDLLAAVGRQPDDYLGKPSVDLSPGLPGGEAVRRLLLELLGMMERNLPGLRADTDPEFLHDFRIAVRRSRSLAGAFRDILPPGLPQRLLPQLKSLGRATGPTRDLDVYLLALPAYRACLPEAMRGDLAPLEFHLRQGQQAAHRRLLRELDPGQMQGMLEEWRGFLATEYSAGNWPAGADDPIIEQASRRIRKGIRRVIREGRSIGVHSPSTALHDLRISCKKVRYLLEFFRELYPVDEVGRTLKVLRKLQDNLGEFQDAEVQADALMRFALDMQEARHDLPGRAFMAIGVLVHSMHKRQVLARQAFAARFARFSSASNQRLYQDLFGAAATGNAAG